MIEFLPFDPLEAKQNLNSAVAINAIKREIRNILNSYVGWFDPFSELIQNSLDAVEERLKEEDPNYHPQIWITINQKDNYLIVTDNGIGLDEQKFKQFLAPSFSFKSEDGITRGHKGVGATYLAYGFNCIQISTKYIDFTTTGKMLGGRKWIDDPNPAGNPQIKLDPAGAKDLSFKDVDRGVSVFIEFDNTTFPSKLSWLGVDNAEVWGKVLRVKTGLGSFLKNDKVSVTIQNISTNGTISKKQFTGIEYLWPHTLDIKSSSFKEIKETEEKLFKKQGANFQLPNRLLNLDLFYSSLNYEDLKQLIPMTGEEEALSKKFNPRIYFAYAYSVKFWNTFNEALAIRGNTRILFGGIQIAANNMPQGETHNIPLQRAANRQNQIHILFHLDNCSADLGRKGFKKEIVDFVKEISRKLVDIPLQKIRYTLRPITGTTPDLKRQKEINDWKERMKHYESEHRLTLTNENFFLPTKKISLTSEPSREQDVIALFNQLIAGGVIRGIKIMSTNERFVYDGLYRVIFEEPTTHHIYDQVNNPLGVLGDIVSEYVGFESEPKVLEYKYCLDGLIENIEDDEKNSNDIGLIVVWETGEDYKENYTITSLLDRSNLSLRNYHGVTHVMTNLTTGQREMDLIVLKELIYHLNFPNESQIEQVQKYENN